jgi:SAM-dependent methyltransferase
MFFPDRIRSILPGYKVLEIGPGANPHPRADHFLEMRYENEQEHFEQSGFLKPTVLNKPVTYYDGGVFPFADQSFDYIICSHVAEHVPIDTLPLFMSEMERVARAGYVEVPLVFYEVFNWQPVHHSLINVRGGEILFADKSIFQDQPIWQIFRALMYGKDQTWYSMYQRKKEFFFYGSEWTNTIPFRIVNKLEELITHEDVAYWRSAFTAEPTPPPEKQGSALDPLRHIYHAIKRSLGA